MWMDGVDGAGVAVVVVLAAANSFSFFNNFSLAFREIPRLKSHVRMCVCVYARVCVYVCAWVCASVSMCSCGCVCASVSVCSCGCE